MSEEKSGTSLNFLDNFNPTEPVSKFIDKVSGAIGKLYEPTQIVRLAKANAEAQKITKISEIELAEVEQRTLSRVLLTETKKQENIENITFRATENISDNAQPENIDDDWLSFFYEKCKNVSDAEMQALWSNILSEEANKPNTYSKRTVEAASLLDKREAKMFTTMCSFIASTLEPYLFIFGGNHPYVAKAGLTFNNLVELEAAGLIKFNENNQDTQYYFLLDRLHLLEPDCQRNSLLYQSTLLPRHTMLNDSVMSKISTIPLKIRYKNNQAAVWLCLNIII